METFFKDVQYGFRALYKKKGFCALTILMLALGVAANTVVFSVVNSILLRKPRVQDPDRVLMLLSTNRTQGLGNTPLHPVSASDFQAWRIQSRALSEISAIQAWQKFTIRGEENPEYVDGMRVTANFFRLLGISAKMGRLFLPGDELPGQNRVVVLSNALWKNHFGQDPNIVGKSIHLDDEIYTVIGVTPPEFRLLVFSAQAWIPLELNTSGTAAGGSNPRFLYVLGRLAHGFTIQTARQEMSTIARRLEQSDPADKDWDVTLLSLQEFQIQDVHVRGPVTVLMATVVLVLLIACANIAGLLLAQGGAREQEFALRVALGASRLRLVRQLLSEIFPIAILGAGLGLLLAYLGVVGLNRSLSFYELWESMSLGIDARVLLFAIGISLAAQVLSGLTPALQLSKPPEATIKESSRIGTSSKVRQRMRRTLVVAEIASAVVLSTSAGLAIIGLINEMHAPPGFNPAQVIVTAMSLPKAKYPGAPQQIDFFQQVRERAEVLPGVQSATLTRTLPAAAEAHHVSFQIEGQRTATAAAPLRASYYLVAPGYFKTMEIPLLEGRTFTNGENAMMSRVVIVNQTFVTRFFPDGKAIGHHINLGNDDSHPVWREIVGVVGNVLDFMGQQSAHAQVYESYLQSPSAEMTLVLRAPEQPSGIMQLLRRTVWDLDKDLALTDMMTMSEVMDVRGGGFGDRLIGELLGAFACLALILTTVGIYGIVSYAVGQRTREIGIRLALGAPRYDIVKLVLREGALAALIGLAIGYLISYPLPSLFSSIFSGFSAAVLPIRTLILVLIIIVTLLASYIPMRRAIQIDPTAALRYE